MKRLAVLISNVGTGTNLQAIIDGIKTGKIKGKIVVVISDTPQAQGLQRAKKHKLKIAICPQKEELLPHLLKYNPDFICLAGWKQIVTDEVINTFVSRILNVHPGLIPDSPTKSLLNPDGTKALWNRGKLADKAIANFLQKHATYAGASIHLLTHKFDFGPVLTRSFVKILPGDTVETLYNRVKQKEHQMYVKVLQKLCNS